MPGKHVCHDCGEPIGSEPALLAGAQLLHLKHFRCHFCTGQIEATDSFHSLPSGKFACVPCYALRLAPKCAKCAGGIVEDGVKAGGRDWHSECFRCSKCQRQLIGKFLFDANGRPIDSDCFWADRLQRVVADSKRLR